MLLSWAFQHVDLHTRAEDASGETWGQAVQSEALSTTTGKLHALTLLRKTLKQREAPDPSRGCLDLMLA